MPVIAVAAAAPLAAASTTADWTGSQWGVNYVAATADLPESLVVSFRVNRPSTDLQGFGFSVSMALQSAPDTVVSWYYGSPLVAPGDGPDQCIVWMQRGWPDEFPVPSSSGEQVMNIAMTAGNGSENHQFNAVASVTIG